MITAINDAPIDGSQELRLRVGMSTVGTTLDLTVLRDGKPKHVKVTITKAPDVKVQKAVLEEAKPAIKGATFSDAAGSVTVTDVEQGSPAWQAGLRPKDKVVAVNRKPVGSVDELGEELKDSNRQTALFLERDGRDMLVVIK